LFFDRRLSVEFPREKGQFATTVESVNRPINGIDASSSVTARNACGSTSNDDTINDVVCLVLGQKYSRIDSDIIVTSELNKTH